MLAITLVSWRYGEDDFAQWMGFTPNLWYYLIPVLGASAFSIFTLAAALGAFD